jgi:hypothetical protein
MNLTIKTPKVLLLAAIMIVAAAFNASALPPGKTGEYQPINSAKRRQGPAGQSQRHAGLLWLQDDQAAG